MKRVTTSLVIGGLALGGGGAASFAVAANHGAAKANAAAASTCTLPTTQQRLSFSRSKYPHIYRHYVIAVRAGWTRNLVLNRQGASARRERLLSNYPDPKPGYDRDEYPPAVARGRGHGLERGTNPTGWMADVMSVPSAENRSQGASMGGKLRRYCDGTRFRYRWTS